MQIVHYCNPDFISFRCIIGSDLILCSGRTVTYYRDLREYHSYVCDDRVLDIAAFAVPNVIINLIAYPIQF